MNGNGYRAAHTRVVAERGAARQHRCEDCGDPAQQWAYDGLDLNVQYGTSNGALCAYSTDPAHYLPLCKPCHRIRDGRAAPGTPGPDQLRLFGDLDDGMLL